MASLGWEIGGGVGLAEAVVGLGGGVIGGVSSLNSWCLFVPLKVSIFAWRLLRDRLPTKANLVTRGILSSTALSCVSGCGEVESTHHLFLSCSTFGFLWALVRSWIGILMVDYFSLCHHFVQFTSSAGGSRAR
ncbi:glutamate-gated kainate-type ion channel receptor subunit GluR18, partial [Trifolium pratense]